MTIAAPFTLWKVIFSPDGNVSAAGDPAGATYVWRAPSWAEIEKAEAAERAGAGKP